MDVKITHYNWTDKTKQLNQKDKNTGKSDRMDGEMDEI